MNSSQCHRNHHSLPALCAFISCCLVWLPLVLPQTTDGPTMAPSLEETATCSASTCDELGWNSDDQLNTPSDRDSRYVCGASDQFPLPGCSGLVTFRAARSFCENAGARLCTNKELRFDETYKTGCGYDAERVWSLTRCNSTSYKVPYGGTNGGSGAECHNENKLYYARCCAERSSCAPSPAPTTSVLPTPLPSTSPSPLPVPAPTPCPTLPPSLSLVPSLPPTSVPYPLPTATPTPPPTDFPSIRPTSIPTMWPSRTPTETPTDGPTPYPSPLPTNPPTLPPSPPPTPKPTLPPTTNPSLSPSFSPSPEPSFSPSSSPSISEKPTAPPSLPPTSAPTNFPTNTFLPSSIPSPLPSFLPSPAPSSGPQPAPSPVPSLFPSPSPSPFPTPVPSAISTPKPSAKPSPLPSSSPTFSPVFHPTLAPLPAPSGPPTSAPSQSRPPSLNPSSPPSLPPTDPPSRSPTHFPTLTPSATLTPSLRPLPSPSALPSIVPFSAPSAAATNKPTATPSTTLTPTLADLRYLDTALQLQANAPSTQTQRGALRGLLETEFGPLKNFYVESVQSARQQGRRRGLGKVGSDGGDDDGGDDHDKGGIFLLVLAAQQKSRSIHKEKEISTETVTPTKHDPVRPAVKVTGWGETGERAAGSYLRLLTGSYVWQVSFQVASTTQDSEDGAAGVQDFLASPDFTNNVNADVGATVDVTSIVSVVRHRPSPVPTMSPQPSGIPTLSPMPTTRPVLSMPPLPTQTSSLDTLGGGGGTDTNAGTSPTTGIVENGETDDEIDLLGASISVIMLGIIVGLVAVACCLSIFVWKRKHMRSKKKVDGKGADKIDRSDRAATLKELELVISDGESANDTDASEHKSDGEEEDDGGDFDIYLEKESDGESETEPADGDDEEVEDLSMIEALAERAAAARASRETPSRQHSSQHHNDSAHNEEGLLTINDDGLEIDGHHEVKVDDDGDEGEYKNDDETIGDLEEDHEDSESGLIVGGVDGLKGIIDEEGDEKDEGSDGSDWGETEEDPVSAFSLISMVEAAQASPPILPEKWVGELESAVSVVAATAVFAAETAKLHVEKIITTRGKSLQQSLVPVDEDDDFYSEGSGEDPSADGKGISDGMPDQESGTAVLASEGVKMDSTDNADDVHDQIDRGDDVINGDRSVREGTDFPVANESAATKTTDTAGYRVDFFVTLHDQAVEAFSAKIFTDAVAVSLCVEVHQVRALTVQAGSVVTETRVEGLADSTTAAAVAARVSDPKGLSASLQDSGLGQCSLSIPSIVRAEATALTTALTTGLPKVLPQTSGDSKDVGSGSAIKIPDNEPESLREKRGHPAAHGVGTQADGSKRSIATEGPHQASADDEVEETAESGPRVEDENVITKVSDETEMPMSAPQDSKVGADKTELAALDKEPRTDSDFQTVAPKNTKAVKTDPQGAENEEMREVIQVMGAQEETTSLVFNKTMQVGEESGTSTTVLQDAGDEDTSAKKKNDSRSANSNWAGPPFAEAKEPVVVTVPDQIKSEVAAGPAPGQVDVEETKTGVGQEEMNTAVSSLSSGDRGTDEQRENELPKSNIEKEITGMIPFPVEASQPQSPSPPSLIPPSPPQRPSFQFSQTLPTSPAASRPPPPQMPSANDRAARLAKAKEKAKELRARKARINSAAADDGAGTEKVSNGNDDDGDTDGNVGAEGYVSRTSPKVRRPTVSLGAVQGTRSASMKLKEKKFMSQISGDVDTSGNAGST